MNPIRFVRLCAIALVAMALFVPGVSKGLWTAALAGGSGGFAQAQNPPAQAAPSQPKSEQAYNLPPDKLAKAITLNKIRLALSVAGTFWGLAVLWLLLATKAAATLGARVESLSRHRWIQGLIFFAAFLVITALAGLPLEAIGHTVSRHFGISVQGWGGWFRDHGKSLAISVFGGSLVMLLFNWIVRVSPRAYWLYLWLITMALTCAGTILEPIYIDPLFNEFEPLTKTHPELVNKLETVVAKTGTQISPDRMFLMKASKKSNGLNAYVTGLGATKRFVMWDTSTDRLPDDEVMCMFGHESGHYVLNHIPKILGITAVGMFFVFWICGRVAEWMVRRFGQRWQIDSLASRAGFLTLIFALSIASFLLTPASNTISRHFEHEADVYGQEAIHGLVPDSQRTAVSQFNHLGEAWLEDPNPNPVVEFWEYSHPSVKNRANFAAHYDPWANGGRGRFFDK